MIEKSIKEKINAKGIPLANWDIEIYRGILTGYNAAFIINSQVKDALIAADPKSAELIRPILRGRDIKRYSYTFANLWLINVHNGIKNQNLPPIDINDYPAIKEHLDTYYDKLAKRADRGNTPYNLRNCVYMNEFSKQKIVYREISDSMNACLVDSDYMLNNKCYLITGSHLIYILSYLNSKLFTKIVLQQVNITGGKGEGFLNKVSLVYPTATVESEVLNLYEHRDQDPDATDLLIDDLFCNLYGLTDSEKKYIMQ